MLNSLPTKICNKCVLKPQCTRSKQGRTIKRHVRQDDLDLMFNQANSREAKRDIRTRQHLMERSFARGTRYGYQRARWRRLWRVQIQEYLTATIQNIMVLFRNVKEPKAAVAIAQAKPGSKRDRCSLQQLFFCFKEAITGCMKHIFPSKWSEVQA